MASTAVRYPTPQRVDGSTQHTSVEVTDPLLWQGQRQGRAEGGASTLQLFNLLLFSVRIAKATCPSDTSSTMVGKWGQHCEPAGGTLREGDGVLLKHGIAKNDPFGAYFAATPSFLAWREGD